VKTEVDIYHEHSNWSTSGLGRYRPLQSLGMIIDLTLPVSLRGVGK